MIFPDNKLLAKRDSDDENIILRVTDKQREVFTIYANARGYADVKEYLLNLIEKDIEKYENEYDSQKSGVLM